MTRCKDAESVTENTKSILAPMAGEEAIVHERLVSVTSAGAGELAVNSGDELGSIVGWGCEIADEWLTRGARNEIHICDSNMNGSSERKAISRRYPNNETALDAKTQRGEEAESVSEKAAISRHSEGNSNFIPKNLLLSNQEIDNSRNSRHSERQRKNPAYYCNTSKLKGIHMKNFFETDHTSMPLGVFASELTPDVGMAMPTYFKSLAAWLPSRLAAKRVAFTLAEVLITLGIIGVVAAVTLPTLVANYQKTVWVNQLKKTYTTLNEGFKQMAASEGCTTLRCADISEDFPFTIFDFTKAKTKEKFVKTFKLENVNVGGVPSNSIYNYKIKYLSGEESTFSDIDAESILFGTTSSGEIISFGASVSGPLIFIDINGLKSPNTFGRDIFAFAVFDFNDTVMVVPFGSKKFFEAMAGGELEEGAEEERISLVQELCSMTTVADGTTCAEKIIMDGWKMNY